MLRKNIRKLCIDKGITIEKLETDLGFANGSISKWDNSVPSVLRVKQVADYFGVSVDLLLSEGGV